MPERAFDVKRLALALGGALLAVLLLTPLGVAVWGRQPEARPDTKLNELSTTSRPLVAGDRLWIRESLDPSPGALNPEAPVFVFGAENDGRRLKDLHRWVAKMHPLKEIPLPPQASPFIHGHPDNQGVVAWDRPAHDRFAETRRIRKVAQYSLSLFLLLGLLATAPGGKRRLDAGLISEDQDPDRPSNGRAWRRGFAVGLLSLGVFLLFLTLLGERRVESFSLMKTLGDFLRYTLAVPAVNLLQDLLFFGLLWRVLGKHTVGTALVFGLGHYLKIDRDRVFEGPTWRLGLDAAQNLSDGLSAIPAGPQAAFGICLVGWVLADLRRRSGSLWLPMGLHAGWFVMRGAGRRLSRDLDGPRDWLFGSNAFHDGALGCVMLLAAWWVLSRQNGRK